MRSMRARVVLLALSSSVILRYQTEIYGADTNSLFMGRDRDQREYVQKVPSAVQIYRLIVKAKSKVKRDSPAIAFYPRESAKHLLFLGSTRATEEITGFSVCLNLLWLQADICGGFCCVYVHSRSYSTFRTHGNL